MTARFKLISTAILLFMSVSASIYAESVFLKNGSIIEGRVINETDKEITIRQRNNKKTVIKRKQILRTLFNNNYKRKVYIHRMDDSVLEGYVVDETAGYYLVRKKLKSRKEIKILKKDINGILKSKKGLPAQKKGKKKSVAAAVVTSFIPFFSGSWITGFKPFGLLFFSLKTVTGALTIWYGATHFYDTDTDIDGSTYATGKVITAAGIISYLCIFIFDAIYSAKNVKYYNENLDYSYEKELYKVKYEIVTRFSSSERKDGVMANKPDGVNVSAIMRF